MKIKFLSIFLLFCLSSHAQIPLIELSKSEFHDSTKQHLKDGLYELIRMNGVDTLMNTSSFSPPSLVQAFPELLNLKEAYIYQLRKRYLRKNVRKISSLKAFSNIKELKWIEDLVVKEGIVCIFDKHFLLAVEAFNNSLLKKRANIEQGKIIDYIRYFHDPLLPNEKGAICYSYDHPKNEMIIYYDPLDNPAEMVEIKFRNKKPSKLIYTLGIKSTAFLYKKCRTKSKLNISRFVIDFETSPEKIYFQQMSRVPSASFEKN
ncbi:MAG: hypothetical protein IT222_03670 [Crocinitomix sp.]|nr:hypothetical protein [Crocinitomix sp.]